MAFRYAVQSDGAGGDVLNTPKTAASRKLQFNLHFDFRRRGLTVGCAKRLITTVDDTILAT